MSYIIFAFTWIKVGKQSNPFATRKTVPVNADRWHKNYLYGFYNSHLFVTGGGRLEVRGHGAGQTVSVDLHNRMCPRDGSHYPSSAVALRHNETNRHQALEDRQEEADANGPRGGLGKGLHIAHPCRNGQFFSHSHRGNLVSVNGNPSFVVVFPKFNYYSRSKTKTVFCFMSTSVKTLTLWWPILIY